MRMRGYFVIAVTLQLFFALEPSVGFEFGDIISSTWKSVCGNIFFKHYVVYVGNKPMKGKEPGQDIFHRSANGCTFGVLAKGRDPVKAKEYDVKNNETTEALMIQRIEKLYKNCGDYSYSENNCEHTATYIRYKEKLMLQSGTVVRTLLELCPGRIIPKCKKYKDMIANAKAELKSWGEAENGCKKLDENNNG